MALTLREQGREHLAHGHMRLYLQITVIPYIIQLIMTSFYLLKVPQTSDKQLPLYSSALLYFLANIIVIVSVAIRCYSYVYTLAANNTLLPYYCFYNLLLAEAPKHTSLINRAHIGLRLLYRYYSFNYDIAHYLHSRECKIPKFHTQQL